MHIPDSMLQGAICPFGAALGLAGVVGAAYLASRARTRSAAGDFAAITALIFALQLLNFPIAAGTSGHLLGGVLAASLLGVPFGILSIALVVTLQALVFADGGLAVLGVNVFNMALLGAGVGGLLHARLHAAAGSPLGRGLALAGAAWLSVVLAAGAVGVELALDGRTTLAAVMPAMIGTHALIGLGEAALTLLCHAALSRAFASRATPAVRTALPLSAALVAAALLTPFASGAPDGLEWVAGSHHLLGEAAPAFVGIMPDYVFPALANATLATAVASVSGVLMAFGLSRALFAAIGRAESRRPV